MDTIIHFFKTKGKELFKMHGGPSGVEIVVWILFFMAWTGLFYFLGRYVYNWPCEVSKLDELEKQL
jgi:hypothetical protein